MSSPTGSAPTPVPSTQATLARAATLCWQVLVIAVVAGGLLWIAGQLKVVLLPIVVATLIVRALTPLNSRLRRAGWPRGLAAMAVLLGFLATIAAIIAFVVPAAAGEFADVGPTVSDAIDDVEQWIVDSGPFDLTRDDLSNAREQAGERLSEALRSSEGSFTNAAGLLVEIPTGGLLALLLTFFILKDGDRFVAWVRGLLPHDRRALADRLALRSWTTLGGFLRGAATLGLLEAVIIGLAMWAVGASLIIPVMLITFAAAFVPVAGAIVAGVLAVLITLVSAGPEQALIVAIIALVVQQLDNDLLAPVIYGRQLQIHPAVILVAVVGGGAAFGLIGTFLAVPVAAIAIGIGSELRADRRRRRGADEPDGAPPDGTADAAELRPADAAEG